MGKYIEPHVIMRQKLLEGIHAKHVIYAEVAQKLVKFCWAEWQCNPSVWITT